MDQTPQEKCQSLTCKNFPKCIYRLFVQPSRLHFHLEAVQKVSHLRAQAQNEPGMFFETGMLFELLGKGLCLPDSHFAPGPCSCREVWQKRSVRCSECSSHKDAHTGNCALVGHIHGRVPEMKMCSRSSGRGRCIPRTGSFCGCFC